MSSHFEYECPIQMGSSEHNVLCRWVVECLEQIEVPCHMFDKIILWKSLTHLKLFPRTDPHICPLHLKNPFCSNGQRIFLHSTHTWHSSRDFSLFMIWHVKNEKIIFSYTPRLFERFSFDFLHSSIWYFLAIWSIQGKYWASQNSKWSHRYISV